jgi:thymidylate kinase
MFAVAVIGADGAGKTTLTKRLLETFPIPMKYLYMGWNPESSNFALPTSRLMLHLKLRSYRREAERLGIDEPEFISTHHPAHRKVHRGKIGTTARLLNRLAEAWYRQMISWIYQLRGNVVVYDRHFLFDAAPGTSGSQVQKEPLDSRIYYWLLSHLYPKPDLVIFLDAPPEVLLERKKETTLEYLRWRRTAFLDQGEKLANFIRVDATAPPDKVLAEVAQHIMQFHASNTKKNQADIARP